MDGEVERLGRWGVVVVVMVGEVGEEISLTLR